MAHLIAAFYVETVFFFLFPVTAENSHIGRVIHSHSVSVMVAKKKKKTKMILVDVASKSVNNYTLKWKTEKFLLVIYKVQIYVSPNGKKTTTNIH